MAGLLTNLHMAAAANNGEAVMRLLLAGDDPSAISPQGKTPWEIASKTRIVDTREQNMDGTQKKLDVFSAFALAEGQHGKLNNKLGWQTSKIRGTEVYWFTHNSVGQAVQTPRWSTTHER
jgi:hypothetical protein